MKVQRVQVSSIRNNSNINSNKNFKAKLEGAYLDSMIKTAQKEAQNINKPELFSNVLNKLTKIKPNITVKCEKFSGYFASFFDYNIEKPRAASVDTYTLIYHDAYESSISPFLRCNEQNMFPELDLSSETPYLDRLNKLSEYIEKAPDELNDIEILEKHKVKMANECRKNNINKV